MEPPELVPYKVGELRISEPPAIELPTMDLQATYLHPLLIDHVVSRILDFITTGDDLLNMRGVCRIWNIEATKVYAKNCGILSGNRKLQSVSIMHDLMTLLENPNGNFPIPSAITLESGQFTQEPCFLDFLAHVAPVVQTLEDHNYRLNIVDIKGKLNFPKLLKYNVTLYDYFQCAGSNPMMLLVHNILTRSPRMEDLRISWVDSTEDPKYQPPNGIKSKAFTDDQQLLVIEIGLLQSIPKTLRRLCISKFLSPTSIIVLSEIEFSRLTQLNLDFRYSPVHLTRKQFKRLFKNCKDTLIELSVTRYRHEVEFPVFPRVTTLTLGLVGLAADSKLDLFAVHFPAVQTLDMLMTTSYNIIDSLFPEDSTAPEVTWVRLPFLFKSYSAFINMLHNFTNLKCLHMILPGMRERYMLVPVFSCPHISGLEELSITFEKSRSHTRHLYLDAVLTGIDATTIWCMENEPIVKVRLGDVKTRPGITDLTNLKKLSIRGVNSAMLRITDITGYFSLMNIRSLRTLQIDNFKMTPTCLSILRWKFEDLSHSKPWKEFMDEMNALPNVICLIEDPGWY